MIAPYVFKDKGVWYCCTFHGPGPQWLFKFDSWKAAIEWALSNL